MKRIDILIPTVDLDNVMSALNNASDANLMYSAMEVLGKNAVQTHRYRGAEYALVKPVNAMVSVYVDGNSLDHVLETVYRAVAPGQQKEWKLSISSMDAPLLPVKNFSAPELQH
jgi:nitrogen regulatory protein PII